MNKHSVKQRISKLSFMKLKKVEMRRRLNALELLFRLDI